MGSSGSIPKRQTGEKVPSLANASRSQVSDEASSPHWHASPNIQWIKKGNNGELHISPKALNITWGGDSRYWRWIEPGQEVNNFKVAAELLQVNWLEITGKVDMAKLSTNTRYEIFYVLNFKVDAFGWHSAPVTFQLTSPDGRQTKKSEILEKYRNRINTWQEIRCGEFCMPEVSTGFVEFGMLEVDSKWWKGSMLLGGVVIRPSISS